MKRSSNQVWDEYLVLHAQAGNSRALRRLLEVHQAPLLAYIARLLGDRHEAQDVLQETLLACSRQIHQLRDSALFRAWLYRIATHQCRSWQRRRYRDLERQALLQEVTPAVTHNNHQQTDVQEVLQHLDPQEQALLSLFYLQGFSIKELSTALGIRPGAVKTRLFRARARFEQLWSAT